MFRSLQASSAHHVLGISPRRQMIAGRGGGKARVMERIERFLVALRRAGRRTILIADADCGDGRLLIEAANRAHALGFVVIDAKGFDPSPPQIEAAVEAAKTKGDPAIRFRFVTLDESAPLLLDEGDDDRADLMLASARRPAADIVRVMDRDATLIRHR